MKLIPHLEQGASKPWHLSKVQKNCSLLSGGLRCAATTGYYLTAFQAETPANAGGSDKRPNRYRKRY